MATSFDIAAYIRGAFSLQSAVVQRSHDEQMLRRQPLVERIAYFFDADILIWMAYPFRNLSYSSIFQSDSDSDATEEADSAIPPPLPAIGTEEQLNAILTLQNLFSGQLIGQRGHPALLTPGHAEELDQKMDEILERVRRAGPQDGRETSHQAHQLAKILSARTTLSLQQFTEAMSILGQILTEKYGSAVFAGGQLLRVFRLLRVVSALTDPEFDGDVLDPPSDSIDEWFNLLSERKKGRSGADHTQNLKRDARSLAQIEMLNERSIELGLGVKYVLVTGDRAIHSAVEGRPRYHSRDWNRVTFIRHPRQYMPILNVGTAGSTAAGVESRVVSELQRTMQDLIATYQNILVRHMGVRPGAEPSVYSDEFPTRLRGALETAGWDRISRQAEAIEQHWKRALTNAAGLNLKLLQQGVLLALDDYVTRLDAQSSDEEVTEALFRNMAALTKVHLTLAIQGRVARQLSPEARSSRSPWLIRYTFKEMVRHFAFPQNDLDSFNSFVRSLTGSGIRPILDKLSKVVQDSRPDEAALLAAALSLRVSDWTAAKHYADRGLDFLQREQKIRPLQDDETRAKWELRYVLCLASRFLLGRNEDHYFATVDGLLECIKRHTRDAPHRPELFRKARAHSELGALHLFSIYNDRLQVRPLRLTQDECLKRLALSREQLMEGLQTLEELNRPTKSRPVSKLSLFALKLQMVTNVAAANVFELIVLDRAPSSASRHLPTMKAHLHELTDLLAQRNDEQAQAKIPMCAVYRDVLAFALEEDREQKERLKTVALGTLRDIHRTALVFR
jgi:hypothetical protein